MSEESPKTVLDYNKPAAAKFNLSKYLVEVDGYYSAFWPLLIVFFAFIVLLTYEISYLRYRKLVITEQLNQYTIPAQKAKEQAQMIRSLRKDMEALAPTHPDVAALMKEFFPETPANSNSSEGASPTPPK